MVPTQPPLSLPLRSLRLAAVAGLVLALLALAPAQAATVSVAAVNFDFQPGTRSVEVGDVVRWSFSGDPHTVTSGTPGAPDGRFDSGIKDAGSTYEVTFDTPGTYRYFCQIHPEQMTGTIVVTAGAEPTPKPTTRPTATPRPTTRPTATPRATTRPTARPTASPTRSATATPQPTASPEASAEPPPPPTAEPSATVDAGASPSPSSSDLAVASPDTGVPSPSAGPAPTEPASGLEPLPIVVGAVILALAVAGGLAWLRRRRAV